MNARLYDPTIGRFITPDTLIPSAGDSQAYNRYSYVGNNPLSYTDPTGHSRLSEGLRRLSRNLKRLTKKIVEKVSGVKYVGGLLRTGVLSSPMFGSAYGLITGDWRSVRTAVVDASKMAATAYAFNFVGDLAQLGNWSFGTHAAAHAATGGIMGELTGGDFRTGFLGSGFGALAGGIPGLNNLSGRMLIGGLGARIGGGDFVGGAVTAGIAYLFNDLMHANVSIRTPAWLGKLIYGDDFIGQGFSFGVAISYPGDFGGEFDIGVYGTAAGGGTDIGTGRYNVGVGFNIGSVRDLNGQGIEYSFNDGVGGLSLSLDNSPRPNITGVGLHLGPGINVGASGTVTRAYSVRGLFE